MAHIDQEKNTKSLENKREKNRSDMSWNSSNQTHKHLQRHRHQLIIIIMEIYTRNTLLQTPSSSPFLWAFWVFSLWSEFHHHQQETKTKAKQNTFIHHFFSFLIKSFTQHFFSLIFFHKIYIFLSLFFFHISFFIKVVKKIWWWWVLIRRRWKGLLLLMKMLRQDLSIKPLFKIIFTCKRYKLFGLNIWYFGFDSMVY